MQFSGDIKKVVLANVSGTITVETLPSGKPVWEGKFVLRKGQHIGVSDDHELVLDDGRAVGIRILNIETGQPGGDIVHFRSNGPVP